MCSNNPHYIRVGLSGQRSRGSEKLNAHSRLLKQEAGSLLVEGSPPAGLGETWITADRSHGQETEGKKAGDGRRKRMLRKTSGRTVCRKTGRTTPTEGTSRQAPQPAQGSARACVT